MKKCKNSKMSKTPQHIAIIMDGNGRWAKMRGEERSYGHLHGVKAVRQAVMGCVECGVRYLTVYAFSTENWGRPEDEVSGLMQLFCTTIESEVSDLLEKGVRLRFSGDRSGLNSDVIESMAVAEQLTRNNTTLDLIIAINYSSKHELVNAVKNIANKIERGEMKSEDISDVTISEHLYINDTPFPDLLIRTSGEHRVSNFMLWQLAYSEFYFMDKLWPDFTVDDIKESIEVYNSRDRRFGLLK